VEGPDESLPPRPKNDRLCDQPVMIHPLSSGTRIVVPYQRLVVVITDRLS